MKGTKLILTTLAAAGALACSPQALAQEKEMDPQAVAAATRYALPIAFDSFMTKCSGALDADGYALSNSARLQDKFSAGSDQAWPEAKQLLFSMAGEETDGMADLLAAMPDESFKPFVDGIVSTMVATEIKSDQCGDIERGLELLDPLPAENIAGLMGFLIELDNRDKRAKRAAAEARAEGRGTYSE